MFGFLYLVLTAALCPYMVTQVIPGMGEAGAAKQQSMSELQLMASSGFEKDLQSMDADAIARSNTQALLDLNRMLQSEGQLDEIKGGPHTHGKPRICAQHPGRPDAGLSYRAVVVEAGHQLGLHPSGPSR